MEHKKTKYIDAAKVLENKNLRKTAPRIAIIEILQRSDIPISENDIKTQMGVLYDRITFYRSVQTLMDAGIIHRIVADNVTVRYVFNHFDGEHTYESNHIHFFCKKCHSVLCLNDIEVQPYLLPSGFEIEECDVMMKGTCNNCLDQLKMEN